MIIFMNFLFKWTPKRILIGLLNADFSLYSAHLIRSARRIKLLYNLVHHGCSKKTEGLGVVLIGSVLE